MNVLETLNQLKNDLVQVMEPNADEVARCVKRAVGDTPLREYGSKSGISASSLSRIINGKVLKPLPEDTLINIVANTGLAPDEAAVLYLELARANGMISKSELQLLNNHMKLRKERDSLHGVTKHLISTVLLARIAERGGSLNNEGAGDMFDVGGGYIKNVSEDGIRYDFRMDVDSEEEKYAWVIWAFPQSEEDYSDGSFNPRALSNRLMRELSPVFLADAWKPDLYAEAKLTFCFVDWMLFECFCNLLKDVKLNNRFSAILIDPKALTVQEERFFHSDKYPDCQSLFDRPPVMSISMEMDDDAKEITGNDFVVIEDNREGE